MRTLIGTIHPSAVHNKQLCFFHRSNTAIVCGCAQLFFFTYKFEGLSRSYEDVPVVPSHGPAKLGPLFLGSMPPHKPLPEELCHALLSVVCRWGTQGIIHSI